MKSTKQNSRRKFIKNAAAFDASISIVPEHVLGRGFLAPNESTDQRHRGREWHGPSAYSLCRNPCSGYL